jgi:predicted SnoaL-like aldol condensation-catalyzing enzyme
MGSTTRETFEHFVHLMYVEKRVRDAFRLYVAPDYVQHNPNLPDGADAAIEALEPMFNRPGFSIEIKRTLVDGDLAGLLLHARPSPDSRGGAVFDLYRFANGKIVEHWDVKQDIPASTVSKHPFF